MAQIIKVDKKIARSTPRTSQVLTDYEYWLKRKYRVKGAYLVNAKSFLKTYTQGGECAITAIGLYEWTWPFSPIDPQSFYGLS